MKEIKAFVGHSFTQQDAQVVGVFLKYFEQLKEIVPNFSWDHAEAAEPLELAEKVRRKFADANTFIGICTAKEYAISDDKLSDTLFPPENRRAHKRDFQAKTSDWVTQELGYAMGRGLALIILQEDGIRQPGGLQGDIEFVPFKRDRPELAFGKLLEMLSALSPVDSRFGATGEGAKPADDTAEPEGEEEIYSPKANWTVQDYRRASLHLIGWGDIGKVAQVNAAFAASDLGGQGSAMAELTAHQEFLKILFGKGGNLDRIAALSAANPDSASIISDVARTYIQFDNFDAAGAAYERAANIDRNSKDGLYYLGRAAIAYAKAGCTDKAHALFEEIKAKSGANKEIEKQLASAIGEFVEGRRDEEAPVIALERQVELSPDDYSARFSLAYKHSQLGNDDLSLYHYLKIPLESRDAITWNNLGVAYDHFKMKSASVSAYRNSEAMGETLAMSNLGYKFMREGFCDEAKVSFNKGFAIPEHSSNIEEGLATLTKIYDEEKEKEIEALKKAAPKIEFYRRLGAALAAPQVTALPTMLQARECVLNITVAGDSFTATGIYEQTDSGLGVALFGLKEMREYKIEYQGRITGRQIEATVARVRTSGPQYNSLLSLSGDKTKVLFVVDAEGGLEAMERPQSSNPSFYTLTVVA